MLAIPKHLTGRRRASSRRSAAWPRMVDRPRLSTRAALRSLRPDPKSTYKAGAENLYFSLLFSTLLVFIRLFPCSTVFRYVLLHSIDLLRGRRRDEPRPTCRQCLSMFCSQYHRSTRLYSSMSARRHALSGSATLSSGKAVRFHRRCNRPWASCQLAPGLWTLFPTALSHRGTRWYLVLRRAP
jgi:hypothetical protein